MWFIELFAGTSALSRVLIGGMAGNRPRIESPVGYMGAKNDLAADILRRAELRPGQGADRLIWNDASTIGHVTRTVLGPDGSLVADILASWEGSDPRALWFVLRDQGPPKDPVAFAASWLWLQARAASGVPVWWDCTPSAGQLVSFNGDGNGPYPAWQATCQSAELVQHVAGKAAGQKMAPNPRLIQHNSSCVGNAGQKDGPDPALKRARGQDGEQPGGQNRAIGGIRSPATIARRILALRAALCGVQLEIHTLPAADFVADLLPRLGNSGRVVTYLDPPYQGATGYELDCPRDTVLGMATDLRCAGAEVIVSESEGLPLVGWHQVQLPSRRKPEWLTMSHLPRRAMGDLFVERAA